MGKGKIINGSTLQRGLMKVEAQIGKDSRYEIKSVNDFSLQNLRRANFQYLERVKITFV